MCGITGFFNAAPGPARVELIETVRRMAGTLTHRGPDDAGDWADVAAGVALGFRRLSIIDLSPAGHQPMVSATGRYTIVFNGEVYNFEAIRAELRQAGLAPLFRGHSDTEVILAAVEAWGLEETARRCVGMFAIALWDAGERRLHLVRDRAGVKPLYYGWFGRTFLFGSELRALREHPSFDGELDWGAVDLLFRYGYIGAPHSIHARVRKLLPGTILTVGADGEESQPRYYWSPREVAERCAATPFSGSESDAADELERLAKDAVGLRMIADVPLGVFLSGGIDSSLVTALMRAQSSGPIKTFTIGFEESAFDEAAHARKVATHLGTEHTELRLSEREMLDVVPRLPVMFDEPFGDPSAIPTHLVSALARRDVTVSLSGDGGDELFGGYDRHYWGRRIWSGVERVPRPLRNPAAGLLGLVPSAAWSAAVALAKPLLPRVRSTTSGDKLHTLSTLIGSRSPEEMYGRLLSFSRHSLVDGISGVRDAYADPARWAALPSVEARLMHLDFAGYMPDDVLVKVDRASMAASLEAREPLLDHRLVEFAWRLPLSMKMRGREGKWLLKQVLYRHVPRSLVDRPKSGFGVPLEAWLRGPLRNWAEDLLSERALRESNLDVKRVRALWRSHSEGRSASHLRLWPVLMFQAWLRTAGRRGDAGHDVSGGVGA